jgi:inorganic pyrophosphatase
MKNLDWSSVGLYKNSNQIIGMDVKVKIDRPLGTAHPKYPDMIYPVNYGYIEGIIGGDGDEQDIYLLGVNKPVDEYKGKVIGIVHRIDDNEDKWIVAPKDMKFSKEEILKIISFQEKYYESILIMD